MGDGKRRYVTGGNVAVDIKWNFQMKNEIRAVMM